MKIIKQALILAIALLAVACSKKEVIPDVPGTMSATVEMTPADNILPDFYRFVIKINRDQNVTGSNVVTIDDKLIAGNIFVNGNKYVRTIETESNEVVLQYRTILPEDMEKPHSINMKIEAGNTQPVTVKAGIENPILLETKELLMGLDQTAILKVKGSTEGLIYASSDNHIANVDATGKVTAMAPGKTVIYAKHNGGIASCGVEVLNYRPISHFIINVNGKDYNSATDTLYVKRWDVIKVKMVDIFPKNATSRHTKSFDTTISLEPIDGNTSSGMIKVVPSAIPFEEFYTDKEYSVTCDLKGQGFYFMIKTFPNLQDNTPYTDEQKKILKLCKVTDKDFYPVKLTVKFIE